MAHTGRPQEVFEKEIPEGKSKVIGFELVWDTDVSMEKVVKVVKCIPGNIQSQGFMEIASLIICSSSYYSTVAKVQDNWKSFEKFADKDPMPWVKVAWMMVAGLKYPNFLFFQRVEGYKSSSNFITSLDFENLVKFSKKQDEKASIKVKASEKGAYVEAKPPKIPTAKYGISRNSLDSGKVEYEPKGLVPVDPAPEDYSRKSQTPMYKKYEFSENKPVFDSRVGSQDYKTDLRGKGLFRKEETTEKYVSPRAREDSFRSWDHNEEMERILLGSPKDKEPQFRTFSRQEDHLTKMSYTPQRVSHYEAEKVSHYSPKDQEEKVYSSSPYFNEKPSYRELLNKEVLPSEDKNYGRIREDFANKYRPSTEVEVKQTRNYEEIGRKPEEVRVYQNEDPEEFTKNFRNKYLSSEETQKKTTENLLDRFRSDYKDENRGRDNKFLEEYYQRKPKELISDEEYGEKPQNPPYAPFEKDNRMEKFKFRHTEENDYKGELRARDLSIEKDSEKEQENKNFRFKDYEDPVNKFQEKYRLQSENEADYRPGEFTSNYSEDLRKKPAAEPTKSEFSDWNCGKCNKKVQGALYECSDCRLINWDQFYKVKSLQHSRGKTEVSLESAPKDDSVRRLYSFSDCKDEQGEWACSSCKVLNKNIFFLCKSCRKPRTQVKEPEEFSKKDYKFSS